MEQLDLFGNPVKEIKRRSKHGNYLINPMLRFGRFGYDKKCGECKCLVKVMYHNKVYYKCCKRGDSRSAATDHRKKWDACRLFEPNNNKIREVWMY